MPIASTVTTIAAPTDRATSPAPRLVFLAAMVVAFAFYLWVARRTWFVADDWDFLAHRSATNLNDLFRPHNEHWSTLPILVFRGLYSVFGLRSYLAYRLPLLLGHLVLAYLMRMVMVRAKVDEWVATAAATLFLFFGSGNDDIVWPFQLGFTGALVFGFTQLLVADHEGPIDRRDALALLAGLAGLLCSGVAVTMTVVVGVAVLARRGWRAAALQTLPLGVVYLTWYVAIGHQGYALAQLSRIPEFVVDQLKGIFRTLGQLPGLGLLLLAVLVFGLALAWTARSPGRRRRRLVLPLALLGGSLLFVAVLSLGRAVPSGPVFKAPEVPSRYLYVLAALILPAMAVAVDAIGRRLPRYGAAVAILFLIPIPGNILVVVHFEDQTASLVRQVESTVVALPGLPIARRLPRSMQPLPSYLSSASLGWLLEARDSGRLPKLTPVSAARANELTQDVVLFEVRAPSRTNRCEQLTRPDSRVLARGTELVVGKGGSASVGYLPAHGPAPTPVALGPPLGPAARRVLVGGLRFEISPRPGGAVAVCP